MNNENLEILVTEIIEKLEELKKELPKTSNRSAMRRCRKRTLELEKMFKTFRKESIKIAKGVK